MITTSKTKASAVSKVQQHFRVLNHIEPDNPSYNIPALIHLGENLRVETLNRAFALLFEKFDVLRSNFIVSGDELVRIVQDADQFYTGLPVIEHPSAFDSKKLPGIIDHAIHDPFDLENDALTRVHLVHFSDGSYLLSLVMHHIITDLHFKDILAGQLSLFYNLMASGKNIPKETMLDCIDCNAWYNDWLKSTEANRLRDKWKQATGVRQEELKFPTDFSYGTSRRFQGNRKHFILGADISHKIKLFSEKHTLTPFNMLLSAWAILLSRMGGQEQLTIGVPFTNRRKAEFKDSQGCFVNILPLGLNLQESSSALEVMRQVRMNMLHLHRIQEIPFLEINKITGNSFKAGFTFEHPFDLDLRDVTSTPVVIERRGNQLDLFLTLWEDEGEYQGYLEFSSELFNAKSVERFVNIYRKIILTTLEQPEIAPQDIDILPSEELEFILQLNQTDSPYENHLCIHEKFIEQVRKSPDAIAIIGTDRTFTYRQFNAQANLLANYLIGKGLKNEGIVALCLDRSVEMMVAIYGILKAGGAYLPLNIDAPAERQEAIIRGARVSFILGFKKYQDKLPQEIENIWLDDLLENPLSGNDAEPEIKVSPHNLAYVIYTSGSTGTPKGVMIEHHSVLNRLGWMQKAYPLEAGDTLLLKTPVSFDVSVWEIFWWGFCGARLAILPEGAQKEPKEILAAIQNHSVSSIHFVPSMFNSFFETCLLVNGFSKLSSLKRIFLSGEALPVPTVNAMNELRDKYPLPDMVNLYGPTEATVDVSWYNCPREKALEKIFIGRPIDNTKLFIIDPHNKIVPLNMPGELIITGVNLARGYLNSPELTKEKFFSFTIPGGESVRAYHTGDQVKLQENGEIEYVGRIDNQVKIRGQRIELGEIESKIRDLPGVAHCIVNTDEINGQKILVAYIVFKPGEGIPSLELKQALAKKLPDYMVPSFFMFMDQIPLTTSGKPDRKRLPKPELIQLGTNIIPASNKMEKILVEIWKGILKVEKISVSTNFFDAGGNSLLAITMANRISRELGKPVSTLSILEHPNIRELAHHLSVEHENDPGKDVSCRDRKAATQNLRNRRRMN